MEKSSSGFCADVVRNTNAVIATPVSGDRQRDGDCDALPRSNGGTLTQEPGRRHGT